MVGLPQRWKLKGLVASRQVERQSFLDLEQPSHGEGLLLAPETPDPTEARRQLPEVEARRWRERGRVQKLAGSRVEVARIGNAIRRYAQHRVRALAVTYLAETTRCARNAHRRSGVVLDEAIHFPVRDDGVQRPGTCAHAAFAERQAVRPTEAEGRGRRAIQLKEPAARILVRRQVEDFHPGEESEESQPARHSLIGLDLKRVEFLLPHGIGDPAAEGPPKEGAALG